MNVKDVRTLPCKAGTTTKSTVEGMPATKLGNNEPQLDRIMIDLRVYYRVRHYKPAFLAILAILVILVTPSTTSNPSNTGNTDNTSNAIHTSNTLGEEKPTFHMQLVVIPHKELLPNVDPHYQILEFGQRQLLLVPVPRTHYEANGFLSEWIIEGMDYEMDGGNLKP